MVGLVIFHHIPKTAGTTLRAIIKRNYRRGEYVELYGPGRRSIDWYRSYIDGLSPADRARIRCVASHTANRLIPVLDERPRVFAMLRDPVERVISLYHFCAQIPDSPGDDRGARMGRAIRDNRWRIEDVLERFGAGGEGDSELHADFTGFFDGQTRAILAPHVDTGELAFTRHDEGTARRFGQVLDDVLDDYYTIGVQERFEASIDRFGEAFGWKHTSAPRRMRNVARRRPRGTDVAPELAELIASYNRLDGALHARHLAGLSSAADR